MSFMHELADFFRKDSKPVPEGEYALRLCQQYYTGRAHEGDIILTPDPAMACTMTLEQAHYKKGSDRYFSEFQIVPVRGQR